jgi:ferric-dicitrate binding protein FerR (iron transport regulator)
MPDRPEFDGLDPELIGRYLAHESSEDETALVRRWLMAHPEAAERLATYLARLDDEAARPPAPDVDVEWDALQARLRAHERGDDASATPRIAPTVPAPASRTTTWWRRGRMLAAASVVLAAGLAYGTLRDRVPAARPSTTDRNTYVTGAGERSELRLPDGTRVRLAPGSQVRVAADFGIARRDVYLDGEAYFDVVHDEARPFTVYAGNTSVRDIGTAFSVRSYDTDSAVQVVVRTGEVAVAGVGRLTAGDVGRVSTSTGETSVRRSVDVDSLLTWMSGRLVYADAPLGDVIEDLHRWYAVDVQLADTSIARLPFTGTLTDVAPAEAVAQIAATMGLIADVDGPRVTLRPDPRKAQRAP